MGRLLTLFLLLVSATCAAAAIPWDQVRDGGHVVLLRHALAPGTGDPPEFKLGDCNTQRNLSPVGREQARQIGDRLRALGLANAPVFTSQWCRCRDTARLLGLTPPSALPALNSFFGRSERRDEQMAALGRFLAGHRRGPTVVLVTHQVVITAATDVFPASGEAVVARILEDGDLEVVGRLPTPAPRQTVTALP